MIQHSPLIDGMENGDVDISVSSEYPIVTEAFKKENISVIGCIDKYQTTYLVGRKDRGIENISDLKGKKIGLSRGGIGEFYLGRFLDLHDMSLQDVTLVDIKLPQLMRRPYKWQRRRGYGLEHMINR